MQNILKSAAGLVLLLCFQGVSAQPPSDDVAEAFGVEAEGDSGFAFGETIYVKVVNVDVFVTDKKGNPITGLTAEDFELTENKSPVAISNFYEFRGGSEMKEGEEEIPTPEQRARDRLFTSHPGLQDSTIPEDQRLNLVVYVDHLNITPVGRNRLFRYLRQFLRSKLDRNDRAMLVSYNRSVKVIRAFTSDPQLIADATYELEKHTGGRSLQNSERGDVLRDMQNAQSLYQSEARVRMFAENVYNDLQFTLDGIREMVNKLAGVPGRKAFLYVSEGLPMRAGEDLFWALDEAQRNNTGQDSSQYQSQSNPIMQSFQYDATRLFSDLGDLAAANRVTFYTIDAAGLRVGGLRSAEYGAMDFSSNIDSIYTRNLQDSLVFLADKTGGRAIVNTNNFNAGFDKIAADFENYYSLGFSPSHSGTGRRYNLDVTLKKDVAKRLGIRKSDVRFRDNYRDKPLEKEMGDAILATLAFGFQSNPLGITLEPQSRIERDDGSWLVTLLVKLPVEKVQLVPVRENFQGRARIWVQVVDSKGRTSSVQVEDWNISIPASLMEEALAVDGFTTFELKLAMRKGEQVVGIAVRDDLNAKASYLSRALVIG